MSQHFLLTSRARTFTVMDVANMSEKQAETKFKKLRWSSTAGKPVCPNCGGTKHYHLANKRRWKCAYCYKQFTITSGTLFANHKLPIKTYLMAIALFANEAKGTSALKMSRELNVQYKTAFVLLHKIREALLETRDESPLEGVCEIDGAYVGNYVRPANNIEDRVDRRLAVNQNPNKRCIIVVRQRADGQTFIGSRRTLTYVLHSENENDIAQLADTAIVEGATVHADEATAYNVLHTQYDMRRVNHSVEYVSEEGACSNQAESFFSRFRRMQEGQTHKVGNLYLANYANEMAYREDTRRLSNGAIFADMATRCIKTLQSNEWTGYWQGNHRVAERIGA